MVMYVSLGSLTFYRIGVVILLYSLHFHNSTIDYMDQNVGKKISSYFVIMITKYSLRIVSHIFWL